MCYFSGSYSLSIYLVIPIYHEAIPNPKKIVLVTRASFKIKSAKILFFKLQYI